MKISLSANIIKLVIVNTILLVGLLLFPISLQSEIGSGDFRPYWSSSFLLRNGQDFSNLSNMEFIERSRTNWTQPYTMYAWFSPTGNLILLPYTFLPFEHAVYYWLLTNILVIFISAILLWHNTKTHIYIPLVACCFFSATLHSLYLGQVNTVVVLGLALFMFLDTPKREFLAGACLLFVTIKPHLVILTLPLLIINAIWQKKIKLLMGFSSALLICALILWSIYPLWLKSFWQVITSGMSSFRETPSISGLLIHAGYTNGKWFWIVAIMLAMTIWWRFRDKVKQRTLIDITILAGMIVSPVGWSYDHVVLLIPLLHVLEWMVRGTVAKGKVIVITIILIAVNLISLYQRSLSVNDVWFFWIPLVALFVYIYAWKQKQIKISDTAVAMQAG